MLIKHINCELCTSVEEEVDALEFRIQKIILPFNNKNVHSLISRAKSKVGKINFNSSDSSGKTREQRELFLKSFAGILVEEICYEILIKHNKNDNLDISLDNSATAINQIDIKLKRKWEDKKGEIHEKDLDIEIRSSFPFKAVEYIVCNDFDILGAYTNQTKVAECPKDFYLRFVYALEYKKENFHRYGKKNEKINYSETTINTLLNDYFDYSFNLKKDLVIYFVGGATKEMMNDDSISYFGNMKSEVFNVDSEGVFRKLKIRNALDSITMLRQLLGGITTELKNEK